MTEIKIVCSSCEQEIIPGTLYCWRHRSEAPKIGSYRVDEGQLLWASVGCKGTAERALSLLVDGEQVQLRDVQQVTETRPPKLVVDFVSLGVPPGTPNRTGDIPLPRLFERLVAGAESVDVDVQAG